jgi:uroporphyrinogen decarboxylase
MVDELNSIERTLRTISFQPVDRVPVDLHNFMVIPRLLGVTNFADFYRDGEAMAEGQIKAWERFGHDVLLLENGTAALAEACGVQVTYMEASAPVASRPAIGSLDEIDKLKVPDPYTDPLLSELLKTTRIVVEEIGDQAFIRGLSEFLMDLAMGRDLEKVHRLLEFCTEVCEIYALAQIEQGAHATSIGDSPSGPDMVSPNTYREFAYPYVKRLAGSLKKKGVILAYHICGNATSIIEDMVRTGASILEIDQKSDQKKVKEAARGKTTLLGPIDPNAVMANGTPDLVAQKCEEALVNLSPGQGFILGPGCALPSTTPDENIDAMIEAAKRFQVT